jgi:hypothetical protein
MQQLPSRTRVRIHSHVTQSRFLHVEDALAIGKIRLFAGVYERDRGMLQHGNHFLDLADARVVFRALARGEPGFAYREYKGTPLDNGGAVSRVLSVQVKGENAYVELKNGHGKLTPTGAVTPAGKPRVEVNVGFKLYEARRLGAAIVAYLRAWDVIQMLENRDAIGQPGPYLVVPATSDGTENGRETQVVTPQPGTTDVHPEQAMPVESGGDGSANGRAQAPEKAAAVARARQTAEELFGPDNGNPPQPASSLQYGDGSAVDQGNSAEVQTFRHFLAEKRTAPASRGDLQAYYRQLTSVH